MMEIVSASVEETREAGAFCARSAQAGDVFALIGELGSGKTEFVRGFVSSLCDGREVRSPTFTIINVYETPSFPVFHFDFYRLKNAEELIEIGFNEYIQGEGVCFIEWADIFPHVIPSDAKTVKFIDHGNGRRVIAINEKTR
jgi:tRNA threonylcarbamoyladenosine biosynthesis protein TsaE